MPDSNKPDERLLQCRNRWLQVCRSRGTPAPDPAQVNPFLASLPAQQQEELEQALLLCLNGREKHRELALVSWAAACTRPDFIARVQAHGLACSGHALFGAGLTLMASGWDMSARIAQLANHPQDLIALRALLAPPAPPLPQAATAGPALEIPASPVMADSAPAAAAFLPPEPTPAPKPAPVLKPVSVSMAVSAPKPPEALAPAPKPGRPKRQGLAPVQHIFAEETTPACVFEEADDPALAAFSPPGRLQVRLFGRESAHTLEVGPHRRGASFMGVQVVTIESARALPDGSGYDWNSKLTVQLAPEEMPLAIAVLMNLSASARFGQHGAERDEFVELRRQEGALVLVTGKGGTAYAVPVKTGVLYYLLSLFCRAMARGLPGSSVTEVLALVKTAHG